MEALQVDWHAREEEGTAAPLCPTSHTNPGQRLHFLRLTVDVVTVHTRVSVRQSAKSQKPQQAWYGEESSQRLGYREESSETAALG